MIAVLPKCQLSNSSKKTQTKHDTLSNQCIDRMHYHKFSANILINSMAPISWHKIANQTQLLSNWQAFSHSHAWRNFFHALPFSVSCKTPFSIIHHSIGFVQLSSPHNFQSCRSAIRHSIGFVQLCYSGQRYNSNEGLTSRPSVMPVCGVKAVTLGRDQCTTDRGG